MNRKLVRSYSFDEREVHEALIGALRAKDIPAPQYVADTPTTKWSRQSDGRILVEWTDDDDVQLF